MLCEACTDLIAVVKDHKKGTWIGTKPKLFDYPEDPEVWAGSHHIVPESFLNACLAECYICSTIVRDCSPELRKQARSFRTFFELKVVESKSELAGSENHYELDFTVEIIDGEAPIAEQQVFDCNGTFKILPKREVSTSGKPLELTPNTFTGRCREQVQHWLDNCCQNHAQCTQDWRTAGSSPSRLLNIHPSLGDRFRLETLANDVSPQKYVTMSHCWGAGMTLTLKKSSPKELLNRLTPTALLPKRFQDAIAIARWMRIDYIWIDALCIIQDSESDWLLESAKMGDIYTNSYCNIAATSADPHKGCFTNRHVSLVEPYAIPNPQTHEETATYVIGYDDFWSNSLLDTPLHARGWVLQERLLSPRTIHFGQEQIFWECRREMACEAYPTGIPQQFRNRRTHAWRQADQMLDPRNNRSPPPSTFRLLSRLAWTNRRHDPIEATQFYAIWSNIVEAYMECQLSFGKDKLVAISGIAQKVARATGQRYLAGLWDNPMLAPSLLWYVLGRRQADSRSSTRSDFDGYGGYRAPSWSWASLEAKVIWNWPAQCDKILINIVKTTVEQAIGSKLGSISYAEMHIRGTLFEATLCLVSTMPDGSLEEDGRYSLQLEKDENDDHTNTGTQHESSMEPTVYLDTPLLPERTCIKVYILPVCSGWQGRSGNRTTNLAGLLLTKVASRKSEAKFARVGIFAMDQSQSSMLYGAVSGQPESLEKRLKDAAKKSVVLV